MDSNNFYIGFLKSGERVLIYKRVKKNKIYYYNVIENNIIKDHLIDLNTLVPVNNYNPSLKNHNKFTKYSSIRIFNKDNDILYNPENVHYYDIYYVDNNGDYILNRKDVLLRRFSDGKSVWYMDISQNKVVSWANSKNEPKEKVNFIRRINVESPIIKKKKLLEMDYKKEL